MDGGRFAAPGGSPILEAGQNRKELPQRSPRVQDLAYHGGASH